MTDHNSPSRRFLDTYLSAPIIRNERDAALPIVLGYRAGVKPDKHVKATRALRDLALKCPDYSFTALEPDEYQWVDENLTLPSKREELERAVTLATKVGEQTDKGLSSWGLAMSRSCEARANDLLLDNVHPTYTKMRFFESFLNAVARSRAAGGRGMVSYKEYGEELYGNEYLGLLITHEHRQVRMVSYSQILMFKDMYYGRFNCLITAACLYPNSTMQLTLSRCFTWALDCLTSYGNKGYELVKSIESLSKTNLIRKKEGPFAVDGSHQRMLEIVRAKEDSLLGSNQGHTDALERILGEARELNHDVEIFGLQKLSGHPLVDPYTGGAKVRQTSRNRVTYRPENLERVRNNFCRMYLEGYIRRHRAWPALDALEGARETRLYHHMLLNELKITPSSYPLEDWAYFRFRKHHDFNFFPNFLDLMDDKSISYYRDQFMATWDDSIKPRSHKRLLIEMLSRPEVNIKEIVDRVRSGDIPFSWLIVSLYPKEREFKIDPRMFGMMVFEMRAFFTCTEANIAEFILPNLPPQTMTLSKIQIQELFQEVTKGHGREGGIRLYEEFDLSGWNGHFHDEVVDPIGYDLEDMFGLPGAFTVIHHFFKDSIMSVRVKECPPLHGALAQIPGAFTRAQESNVLWPEHDAGIEGLAQKIWTCPTYSMFDLAMQKFGIHYYLIGQADNQTCTAWVTDEVLEKYPGGIRELADQIAREAHEECQKVGHELNLDECIQSSNVITYSKDVYIDGVEYYTSLKAFSRVFPHSASDFPSVINSVAAISGQCLAGAEKCKDSLVPYILSLFHTALYLTTLTTRKPVECLNLPRSLDKRMTNGLVSCLLAYPGELGGLPIGHILGFIYKGGPDPLSKAVASLKLVSDGSSTLRRVNYSLMSGRWMEKTPDLSVLLDDPYALPLRKRSTPEMAILRDGLERVKYLAANRNIQEVLTFVTGGYEDELRRCLSSANPFNPVLMADLLGLSLIGVTRTSMKMFTSTQTIQSLLQGSEEANPCARILATGSSQFLSLVMRIQMMDSPAVFITDVYETTEELRRFWDPTGKVKISGVTGITPVDLPISYEEPTGDIQGFKLEVQMSADLHPHYSRGPETVYFGRPTREHRSEHGYKIVTSSAPDRAISQLSRIATQPGLDRSFVQAVAHVVATRGNMDLERTLPLLGKVYGGSIEHRYQSRLGHLSANILGTTSFASHCVVSTDTAAPISGGEDDYPVMVQAKKVALTGLAALSWPFPVGSRSITLRTDKRQWVALDESTIRIDPKLIPANPPVTVNPLVFSSHVFLERSITRHHLPMIQLIGLKGREASIPYLACWRSVYRQMSSSHTASAVADRGSGFIHLDLDIAEIARLGGMVMVEVCCLAICQITIDALFSRSESEWRWTPMPVIMSLVRASTLSLSRYLRHPLVQLDSHVRNQFPAAGTHYPERRVTQQDKIERFMVDRCLILFNDPGSHLYEAPIVLFYDDPEGEAWRALSHAYRRSCLQAASLGEIDLTLAYTLVRRNMTAAVMTKRSDLGRATRIAWLISNILDWAKEHHRHQLAASLSKISQGKVVMMTQCAMAEALRLARRLEIPTQERQTKMAPLDQYLAFPQYNLELRSSLAEIDLITVSDWDWTPHSAQATLWEIRRLRGRIYGGDSSVGYSYLPLVSSMIENEFFMIGCGHGAGPAVLIRGGATRCYGLDLQSDIEPISRMNGQTTPIAFISQGLSDSFTRITPTSGWNGDIKGHQAVTQMRQWVVGGKHWIIDIPLKRPEDLIRVITQLGLIDLTATIWIRLIGPSSKFKSAYSICSRYNGQVTYLPVFRWGDMVEGWISVVTQGSSHSPMRCIPDIPGDSRETITPNWMSATGGSREYLIQSACHGLMSLSGEELERGISQLEGMVGASTGELEHRFTYHQWTDVLEALIVRLILTHENPTLYLVHVALQDTITVPLGLRSITKRVDKRLKRNLLKVISRVL